MPQVQIVKYISSTAITSGHVYPTSEGEDFLDKDLEVKLFRENSNCFSLEWYPSTMFNIDFVFTEDVL